MLIEQRAEKRRRDHNVCGMDDLAIERRNGGTAIELCEIQFREHEIRKVDRNCFELSHPEARVQRPTRIIDETDGSKRARATGD